MQAKHSRWLAHCIALATLSLGACGDHDEPPQRNGAAGMVTYCGPMCGGEAAGGEGAAGASQQSGRGGSAGRPMGGTTTGGNATAGTGTTLGGEGGGAPDGPLSEELTLCGRLSKLTANSNALSLAFDKLNYADCRVNWLNQLYLAVGMRADYVNELKAWNLRFWGCQASPVDDFLLVFGTPPLSQADADIVIDHYLSAAIAQLDLSTKEQTEMRAALARLAKPLVVSASTEPSQPSCQDPNAGGAGGIGGAGGETSGGAGAEANGGGGAAGAPTVLGGNGGLPE